MKVDTLQSQYRPEGGAPPFKIVKSVSMYLMINCRYKSCFPFFQIPVRHTFTLEQKRILMKHYESGMTGQSLAYHSRIMQCAQEAGVDFDIVRVS